MCIAILNKSNLLEFDVIKNSFDNNRDGASFTYIHNNKLEIVKELEFTNHAKFYDMYKEVRNYNDKPILLHFRIGTSGERNEKNLHPFFVNQKLCMVHNGIIDIPEINPSYNDSYHFAIFCRKLKKHHRLLNKESFEFMTLESFIGTSKIVYLSNVGTYSIMNESLGHWDKSDNWYSNHTYQVCDYYNVGGKSIKKTYSNFYDWELNSFNHIEDIDNYQWFDTLSYADRQKMILELYGYDYEPNTAHKITNELMTLYKVYNLKSLYKELIQENL
jgi:hypothetical protein